MTTGVVGDTPIFAPAKSRNLTVAGAPAPTACQVPACADAVVANTQIAASAATSARRWRRQGVACEELTSLRVASMPLSVRVAACDHGISGVRAGDPGRPRAALEVEVAARHPVVVPH